MAELRRFLIETDEGNLNCLGMEQNYVLLINFSLFLCSLINQTQY